MSDQASLPGLGAGPGGAVAIARPRRSPFVERSILPGFRLSLGITLVYLGAIVVLPLIALAIRPWELGLDGVWQSLTAIYAPHGPLGEIAAKFGIKTAYSPLGIFIALVFIGLPFVVRSLQPVLLDLDRETEEAAKTLGANALQRAAFVVFPPLAPALVSGVSLAFARAVGEYGSVVFIAGNLPGKTEIAPLLIVIKLEQYDYAGAAAVGLAMVVISFGSLVLINGLQLRLARRGKA